MSQLVYLISSQLRISRSIGEKGHFKISLYMRGFPNMTYAKNVQRSFLLCIIIHRPRLMNSDSTFSIAK